MTKFKVTPEAVPGATSDLNQFDFNLVLMSSTHIKYNAYLVVEVSHTKKLWPKTFTGWKYINSNMNNNIGPLN